MVSPLLPAFGCLQIYLEFETDSLSVGWYRYTVYFSVGFAFRGLNPPLFLGFPCGTPPIKINLEFHFYFSCTDSLLQGDDLAIYVYFPNLYSNSCRVLACLS